MSDDADVVRTVCELIADRPGDTAALATREIRRLAPLRSADDQATLAAEVVAHLCGLGELDVLLRDPTVDEVLVNGGGEIWIDRHGDLVGVGSLRHATVEHLIERVIAPLGRRIDRASPIVDARLPDGSRMCAAFAPVAVDGAVLSIRRFRRDVLSLDDFASGAVLELLGEVVAARCNVVVSGATSAGKTSLVAAMLATLAPAERLVVVEDTTELPLHHHHTVRLEARPPSVDGPAPIDLGQLVRTALRLRPDRIVVGEVRGDEVLALVQAMNTGHDGSISTCHANGALDALLRLESLVMQAAPTWPLAAIRHHLARSIDVVVHLERDATHRHVTEISEVAPPGSGADAPRLRRLAGRTEPGAPIAVVADLGRRRR
ncbi:MAG TPA: ATPase, T2SS/T4P/T4SS family [Ilumatobacteraceae bacterium]|nr:ATPase, T2SS/T4P/T4SS family [Ilumatobacteraceae bacterium]